MQYLMIIIYCQMNKQGNNLPILYAQNCPEQPIIPKVAAKLNRREANQSYQNEIQDQLGNATRVISHKQYIKQFQPRIIRSRRIPYNRSFQLMEHDRQIQSMKKRIQNCKSISQRKKDKNDPIMYPPYFIRERGQNSDVKIQAYTKKALNSTVWKMRQKQINKIYDQQKSRVQQVLPKKKPYKKYNYNLSPQYNENQDYPQQAEDYNPEEQMMMPSPAFHRKDNSRLLKPIQSAPVSINVRKKQLDYGLINLPPNDVRGILDYIYNHLVYKQKDLQALKSRMAHAYGKDQIKQNWKLIMRLLQRDI